MTRRQISLRSDDATSAGVLSLDCSLIILSLMKDFTNVGDQSGLERAIKNLLDNAGRHAAAMIPINVTDGNGRLEMTIDNDGPGIAIGVSVGSAHCIRF